MTNALTQRTRTFEHNGREWFVFDDVMKSLGRSPGSLIMWDKVVPKANRMRCRLFDFEQGCIPPNTVRCIDKTGRNEILAYHQSKVGTHGRGAQVTIGRDRIFFTKVGD